MRKNTKKSSVIAIIIVCVMLLASLPVWALKTEAAAKKPSVAKKTTVQVDKKKSIKIQKNGYTIKKIVSAKSSKKSIAKVSIKGKKVIVNGIKAGKSKVKIKIRAKKSKTKKAKTKTFTLTTLVIVKKSEADSKVDQLIADMSLDQKISQMIMPSFRRWDENDKNVTELSEAPALAEALRRHQYGGVILFGQNIVSTEQTARLICDLQKNNAKAGGIPYMVASDQEGGAVNRLSMGTRGTGSMAIGATGDSAAANAKAIGEVLGEEMEALGINVNLGPCVDVITDLTDLGMSTRVYSDDADTNAKLGMAFKAGVSKSGVITTYKHFPGAGDGSDYPTSIKLTLDELEKTGLKAYKKVIEGGAEMVMTSATTFPEFDDEQMMADGVTKGYYPATMSSKIVTGLLRKELGFDGVVITDALEMDQFITEPDTGAAFFAEEKHTVSHDIKVAKECINVGCDILLLPTDMTDEAAVQYYDDYIEGIEELVKSGEISEKTIDKSVKRILSLKEKHGILDMDTGGTDIDKIVERAKETVGSDAHHAVEIETAKQAVTLIKNDGVLPLSGEDTNIVIIGNSKSDNTPIMYAVSQLISEGIMPANTKIINHITGEISGSDKSDTSIVIDYFYKSDNKLVYSDTITDSIKKADVVVCLSKIVAGIDQIQDTNPIMQGVSRALGETHDVGAAFVLLSTNLPMDTARFTDSDAIVCAYLAAGFGIDPTARTSGTENVGAFNANVPVAIEALFGTFEMTGTLPINIPTLVKVDDGQEQRWEYKDD